MGVSLLNSVEWAPLSPRTFLPNSITAHCIPRQIPKKGILFSLAYLMALILPSMPLCPNPGATRIPSKSLEFFRHIRIVDVFGMECFHIHPAFIDSAGMDERFIDGFVGILQFNIFPDQADRYFCMSGFSA